MSNNDEPRRENEYRDDGGYDNGGKKPLLKRILLWVAGAIVLLFVAGCALFFYYASSAPKISQRELSSQNTTIIYDANNKVISRLGAQKRDYASDSQIPTTLKHAVVAIEDRHFYKHHGIDIRRIFGAAINNVIGRSDGMQGGSTLTQQLVKLSVFSTAQSDRTFKRKAQEAWLALNVERHFSKDQILKYYINKVYMGNGVYGMRTAAQYYYGKELKDLDLSQLALLAGMPQSPTNYNPLASNTKYATARRNEVLNAMVRAGYITKSAAQSAASESVTKGLDPSHGDVESSETNVKEKVVDPYVKEVLAQLEAEGYNPNTDGLLVHTNMDLGAQKKLYNAANNEVSFQSNNMQAGAAVTDPHNGQVIAMLGGRHTSVIYGLNRAVQQNRSSGSTAKPLMDYGPAIEYLQWPTFKTVSDTKFYWPGTNKVLHDFDNKYKGNMTMRSALVESRNVPAIRTLQTVGIKRATTFLKGLGISQKQPYTLQNGIALYISPLQMSAAYAAFANGGTYYKPYYISSITTMDGKTKTYLPHGKRAMSKATAYMMTDMLKGVFTNSASTGTSAYLSGVHQAGKTGTTDFPDKNESGVMDSWMAGYTKNYSIGIWTGFDHPYSNGGITSSYERTAVLLYKSIMQYLDEENHASNWKMPSTVEAIRVNGKRQLVIKDSKWALMYGAWTSSDSGESSSESSSSSSSSSSGNSRSDSISESRTVESILNGGSRNENNSSSAAQSSNANSTSTPTATEPTTGGNQ